jgi:hypothetical protein
MSTDGWFGEISPADQTSVFTPDELQEELRILQDVHGDTYGYSLWLQEYFCSFDAAVPGSFWGDSIQAMQARGVFQVFEPNPALPVFTAGDLGRVDDTSIWWYQVNGNDLDIIDFWTGSGCEIDDPSNPERSIVHILLERAERQGYQYAMHWWPHDARPRRQGMGGKSILQQFQEAGRREKTLGRFGIVPRLDVQEGIQAARKTFQRVRRFHAERCAKGLEALRAYHREWDEELRKFNDSPVHDWSSNPADGWRYLSLSWQPSRVKVVNPAPWTGIVALGERQTTRTGFGKITDAHLAKRRQAREWRAIA